MMESTESTDTFIGAVHLLRNLGVTANYAGFFQTAYAVSLAASDPDRLQFVTKLLYPDVAVKYKTSIDSVEKNIRKVCDLVWEREPLLLSLMAGHELKKKPGNSGFLAILAIHLMFC